MKTRSIKQAHQEGLKASGLLSLALLARTISQPSQLRKIVTNIGRFWNQPASTRTVAAGTSQQPQSVNITLPIYLGESAGNECNFSVPHYDWIHRIRGDHPLAVMRTS